MQADIARPADTLSRMVEAAVPGLLAIMEYEAGEVPEPGAWSAKEILGHLIDSATNNHRRFVLAQIDDAMIFPGYAQDDWVVVQRYDQSPWAELIELWRQLNGHLAHVFRSTAEDELHRVRTTHNLHEIAFRPVLEGAPVTLHWFQEDYVVHLQHHLKAIPDLE
jgi:hypothetical protein